MLHRRHKYINQHQQWHDVQKESNNHSTASNIVRHPLYNFIYEKCVYK